MQLTLQTSIFQDFALGQQRKKPDFEADDIILKAYGHWARFWYPFQAQHERTLVHVNLQENHNSLLIATLLNF